MSGVIETKGKVICKNISFNFMNKFKIWKLPLIISMKK